MPKNCFYLEKKNLLLMKTEHFSNYYLKYCDASNKHPGCLIIQEGRILIFINLQHILLMVLIKKIISNFRKTLLLSRHHNY